MRTLLWLLLLIAAPAGAQPRAYTDEWSLNLFAIGTKNYRFEGGASARNDGGAGIGLTLTRNLNEYLAFGIEATLAEFNYRATVVPGAGNGAASFDTDGDMESGALRAHLTWNVLARPLTPFLTASAGVIFLDPRFEAGPPANACWVYPWYGEVCSDKAPNTDLARFTYGVGAGVRYDLPRRQGFVRASLGAEWIQINEALSAPGYVVFRADFGIPF